MEQSSLNWVFGVVNIILGAVLTMLWDSYKELKKTDKELAEKVADIEVVVAGQYMKRDDFEKVTDMIFLKLDKIMEKLDTKADK